MKEISGMICDFVTSVWGLSLVPEIRVFHISPTLYEMTFNRRVIVIHRYLSNAYNRFNGKVSDISPYLRTSSRYNHPASIRFLSDQIQDKKTLQQKDDPIDSNEMAHPKSVSNVITEVDISTFTIEVPIRLPGEKGYVERNLYV
jgi:hypothetical protein